MRKIVLILLSSLMFYITQANAEERMINGELYIDDSNEKGEKCHEITYPATWLGKKGKIKLCTVPYQKSFPYSFDLLWGGGDAEDKPAHAIRVISYFDIIVPRDVIPEGWFVPHEERIPLSSYVDLSDPHDISVYEQDEMFYLKIRGSDAGYAYTAVFEIAFAPFSRIIKRTIYAGIAPLPLEETNYTVLTPDMFPPEK